MTRVLVVNHAHSEVCGIHDLGKRIFGCLQRSTVLEVGYAECNSLFDMPAAFEPDVVIYNYRADLMPWATTFSNVATFAALHQYEEATADARAAAILAHKPFTGILALDPLLQPADPRVHAVGRPIPETVRDNVAAGVADAPGRTRASSHPLRQIGSFGFAFPHKGFQSVAGEIADQCDEATYNLHMPEAYFNGAQGAPFYTDGIVAACSNAFNGKPGLWLHHTAEHLAERELVARLAANDVNCLFYAPGQPDAGLSSAVDYCVAARRPLLISDCEMFRTVRPRGMAGLGSVGRVEARHGTDAPSPFPEGGGAAIWPGVRLGDILDNYDHFQREADELYAWHHGRLVADIEQLMESL